VQEKITMIKLLPLIFAATTMVRLPGCAQSPAEAGAEMARMPLESGSNPSPAAKAEMQA